MNGGKRLASSQSWDGLTEQDIVRSARSGNREAFGELVRRHRSQVYGWANAMARDAYLADDIVQDAFVDAYVQMGSLIDENRFGPWLRRIVRNRAYMRLRRGGPYRRERPSSDAATFEQIAGSAREDVAASMLHKELIAGLADKFSCLSKREQAVLEAIVLRHQTVDEIARALGITKVNVYNCMTRARAKLKLETLRAHVEAHIRRRRALGLPRRHVLHPGSIYF